MNVCLGGNEKCESAKRWVDEKATGMFICVCVERERDEYDRKME